MLMGFYLLNWSREGFHLLSGRMILLFESFCAVNNFFITYLCCIKQKKYIFFFTTVFYPHVLWASLNHSFTSLNQYVFSQFLPPIHYILKFSLKLKTFLGNHTISSNFKWNMNYPDHTQQHCCNCYYHSHIFILLEHPTWIVNLVVSPLFSCAFVCFSKLLDYTCCQDPSSFSVSILWQQQYRRAKAHTGCSEGALLSRSFLHKTFISCYTLIIKSRLILKC